MNDYTKKELKYHKLYMDIAYRVAEMSHSQRLKVGAICVKNGNIISKGWNDMPPGFDNCCENSQNATKKEVLHAEQNMIIKLAKSTESVAGSVVYLTHSPCIECAKLMSMMDLEAVYYKEAYRCSDGVLHIQASGIKIERLWAL